MILGSCCKLIIRITIKSFNRKGVQRNIVDIKAKAVADNFNPMVAPQYSAVDSSNS